MNLSAFVAFLAALNVRKSKKRLESAAHFTLLCGLTAFILSGVSRQAFAQDPLNQPGSPTFTTAQPVELGFINVSNGNLHLQIPLGAFPQRGGRTMAANLVYDSRIWQQAVVGSAVTWQPTNVPSSQGGWRFVSSGSVGTVSYLSGSTPQLCSGHSVPVYMLFKWMAPDGTVRNFIRVETANDPNHYCTSMSSTSDALADDSSGYHMYANLNQTKVLAPDGTQVFPNVTDTNGNFYSTDSNGNVIDTLGRTPVTKTSNCNGNASQTCYDVLNAKGATSRFTVTTESISVNTSFGVANVTEYSTTITVLQSVTLPDNTSYQFSYDSGTTAGHYGLLTGITLPTGGQISYAYRNFAGASTVNQWVSSHSSGGGTWSFTQAVATSCPTADFTKCQQVTMTKPSGDSVVYQFGVGGGAWKSQVQHYSGSASSGTLLSTETLAWNTTNTCGTGACNIQQMSETVTLPVSLPGTSSLSRTAQYTYDSIYDLNIAQISEWKYYSGNLPSSSDRNTFIVYQTAASYTNKNILNRPTSVTIKDGAGTQLAQTTTSYDSTALVSVPGIAHHDDTNFGTANTVRGNVTQVQRWTGSGTTSTTITYDTTGQPRTTQDNAGNQTAFSYTDNFFKDAGDGPSNPPQSYVPASPTNAYLTQVSPPLIPSTTYGYYFGTGQLASTKGANSVTAYSHFFDSLNRPTSTVLPNGGWSYSAYNASETQIDSYTGITAAFTTSGCTGCLHSQVLLDNLGRPTIQKLMSDPEGATTVTTSYDSTDRVLAGSHPFRSTSDSTYGLETTSYDGIDHVTQVTHPDNSSVKAYYGAAVSGIGVVSGQQCPTTTCGLGYPILSVDEAGKKREVWIDGFGKTIEVDEPPSIGIGGTGSGTVNGNERNAPATSPTAGTGSGTVNGGEQSIPGTPGTGGTASVTISGTEHQVPNPNCDPSQPNCKPQFLWDTGGVSITVNGFTKTIGYGQHSTSNGIAGAFATAFNTDSTSPVTATASGSVIALTAKATGPSSDYSLSSTSSSDLIITAAFRGTPSESTLTGGANAVPAVYDTGTTSITVNGCQASASYGQGSNATSVANALASQFGTLSCSPVNASVSGSTVNLTAKQTGLNTNYSLSSASSTSQPGKFSQASFTISVSDSTLTGGSNGSSTIYDSGTVSITVNGFQASAPYGQTSTATTLAAALANVFNSNSSSPVTASASGSTVSLTANQGGTGSDYTLSSSSSTSQPSTFSGASFSVSVSGSALTGGSNPGSTTPAVTYYTYDLLGNLKQVTQGSQTRSYNYDALSRVTSATVPEIGNSTSSHTSNFYYTTSGGGLCSGNPSAVCRSTDPRGITITYTYDTLIRLTGKTYSDSTPAVSYFYDQTTYNGLTISNGKGRPTGMSDGSGATAWSYDVNGNIVAEQRTIAGVTKTMSYSYNLDGSPATITYPSGRQVAYTVSDAERPTSAKDVASGTQYAITASYAAPGVLQSVISGQMNGGFGGVTESHSYNNRLEYSSTQASSSNGTALNLSVDYATPLGNNGNITSISNNVDTGRTLNFQYDPLGRITSAASEATSGSDCWGQNFGIDSIANLSSMNVTQCSAGSLSLTVNGNNQITSTGFGYDAAGNTTGDGAFSYTYDAENRVTSAAGVTYTYDGNGLRVKKSNGTLYWRNISGDALAESDLSGNIASEYVFFAGRRVARRDSSGNVFYYFADHLGSTRTITDATGHVCYDADFTPYGQEFNHTNSCPQNYKFTGYERDPETGNDYAFARYYNPRLGRFMSPDPLAGNTGGPQSLNRYAYVLNNPLSFIDPSGLGGLCAHLYDAVCPSGGGGVANDPFGGSGSGSGSGVVVIWLPGGSVQASVESTNPTLDEEGNATSGSVDASSGPITSFNGEWVTFTQIASSSNGGGNSSDSWWGTFGRTFVNGVLHGDRQPGQSFGACVLQNADETTFGGHKALIGAMTATAAAAAANASQVKLYSGATVSGTANIALNVARFVYIASGATVSMFTVMRPVANTIGFAGRAAPYVAAAEAGLLIGSAINCR